MTHYIAMGGEHGCMPDNCQAYESLQGAIDGLNCIYELEQWQLDNLAEFSDGYSSTELYREQGGAYCEISACDCSEPWEHGEGDSAENWPDYAGEEAPEEGDYIIESIVSGPDMIYKYNDSLPWCHAIQKGDDIYKIISEEMEREKYWPNVWTLSDHGNYNLISLDSLKEE